VSDSLKKQEKNNECLIIKDLKKKFGNKTAVNGVNLKMYNG
jgi:ABC-type multidrug transport system ATPase subunit